MTNNFTKYYLLIFAFTLIFYGLNTNMYSQSSKNIDSIVDSLNNLKASATIKIVHGVCASYYISFCETDSTGGIIDNSPEDDYCLGDPPYEVILYYFNNNNLFLIEDYENGGWNTSYFKNSYYIKDSLLILISTIKYLLPFDPMTGAVVTSETSLLIEEKHYIENATIVHCAKREASYINNTENIIKIRELINKNEFIPDDKCISGFSFEIYPKIYPYAKKAKRIKHFQLDKYFIKIP